MIIASPRFRRIMSIHIIIRRGRVAILRMCKCCLVVDTHYRVTPAIHQTRSMIYMIQSYKFSTRRRRMQATESRVIRIFHRSRYM